MSVNGLGTFSCVTYWVYLCMKGDMDWNMYKNHLGVGSFCYKETDVAVEALFDTTGLYICAITGRICSSM